MMQKSGAILIYLIGAVLFNHVTGIGPILGLIDPNCIVYPVECPNENVNFYLYTNKTRDSPIQLDPFYLYPDDFYPKRPVKILIHGYTGHRDFAPNSYVRPVLLDYEDVYVISVDYGPLVRKPCYFTGVANLPIASKCLAQLINNLVNEGIVDNEDIHLIGYSLGAHVAGQTANFVDQKLRRITGLDPAKPMFITVGIDSRLDRNDADFVDIIHTDVMGRGLINAMGHVDFYPNLGPFQPGCKTEEFFTRAVPGSCNHDRAPEYYAESIASSRGFWAYSCSSWLHKIFGLCPSKGNDAVMGYFVDENTRGSFFLETSNQTPYALGAIYGPHRSQPYYLKYDEDRIIYDDDYIDPTIRAALEDIRDDEIRSLDKLCKFYDVNC